jgi:hypothetical protein
MQTTIKGDYLSKMSPLLRAAGTHFVVLLTQFIQVPVWCGYFLQQAVFGQHIFRLSPLSEIAELACLLVELQKSTSCTLHKYHSIRRCWAGWAFRCVNKAVILSILTFIL